MARFGVLASSSGNTYACFGMEKSTHGNHDLDKPLKKIAVALKNGGLKAYKNRSVRQALEAAREEWGSQFHESKYLVQEYFDVELNDWMLLDDDCDFEDLGEKPLVRWILRAPAAALHRESSAGSLASPFGSRREASSALDRTSSQSAAPSAATGSATKKKKDQAKESRGSQASLDRRSRKRVKSVDKRNQLRADIEALADAIEVVSSKSPMRTATGQAVKWDTMLKALEIIAGQGYVVPNFEAEGSGEGDMDAARRIKEMKLTNAMKEVLLKVDATEQLLTDNGGEYTKNAIWSAARRRLDMLRSSRADSSVFATRSMR